MAAPTTSIDAGPLPAPDVSAVIERGPMTTLGATVAAPIPPGEILMEELLIPLGVSQRRLSVATGLSLQEISELVPCKCRITADLAHRLAAYFGTSDQFWFDLQDSYDLESAEAACLC